jgi:hypothetical protein
MVGVVGGRLSWLSLYLAVVVVVVCRRRLRHCRVLFVVVCCVCPSSVCRRCSSVCCSSRCSSVVSCHVAVDSRCVTALVGMKDCSVHRQSK